MKYKAGFGKHETTCLIPGVGMMGYGNPHNFVKEVGTPLHARAMVLKDESENIFILIHLEQCFVTQAIKDEILKRLAHDFSDWKITEANLMITAQHTHSGPGGYGHFPFYNFTVPGFQIRVFNAICTGAMEAVKEASQKMTSVNIHWGKHRLSDNLEVAFNRSMNAYLNNEDALKLKKDEWHLAVNREMEGLYFTDEEGREKAFINWFGVHTTSVSPKNHRIHYDNKGVAAELYEKTHPGSIAFYMQGAAGDVSPNFIWDQSIFLMRGKFKDQYESCEYNGEIQFRESEKIRKEEKIEGQIQCFHQYMNMAEQVAPAAHGVAFFEGTAEGPGMPKPLGKIVRLISRAVRQKNLIRDPKFYKEFYESHAPKDVLLDHRTGSFLGIPLSVWKKLPKLPDPAVEGFRRDAANEAINTLPWAPFILPFQFIVIGPIAIVAVPGEITTTSAKRLKAAITKQLEKHPIKRVIISSYSNEFMGYITTPEEYATQSYEAGHTIYGHSTLAGIMKGFEGIVSEFQGLGPAPFKNTKLFYFPADELARRSRP